MKAKTIFIIDTSDSDKIFLVLFKEGFLLNQKCIDSENRATDKLIGKIDNFLTGNNLGIKDIDLIGAVLGPGSYTGLKIGLTIANTLAWALNIPVAGMNKKEFDSYQDLAEKLEDQNDNNKFEHIIEPYYDRAAYYE